jgi:DNA adenine methylase
MAKTTARVISPVVYYGGKNMLAPWIVSHFPAHRNYIELFGGGASVLLAKQRAPIEIYNDIEGEVVNFFRMARDRGEELKRALWLTPYARDEFEAAIYADPVDDPIERARRFLVISRQAFGGCGVSERCLTAGNWKRPSVHPSRTSHDIWLRAIQDRMDALIARLQGVAIENRDYEEVLRKFDTPQTLFYCAPPYLMHRRDSRHQYRFDFSAGDHQRLARILRTIEGKVIVSYHDDEFLADLYPGWQQVKRASHNRSQLVRGNSRRPTTEVLIMNWSDL